MKNMKTLFNLIVACIMVMCMGCDLRHEDSVDFKLNRGVNISHWLSQSNARGKARADFLQRKMWHTLLQKVLIIYVFLLMKNRCSLKMGKRM